MTTTNDKISAMFSGLGQALKELGVNLRDNVFITAYIMDMFSYSTMEAEAIWEANGENPNLYAVVDILGYVENDNGSRIYDEDGNIDIASKLSDSTSTDTKDKMQDDEFTSKLRKELLTMTQMPISPINNASYLSEVEYIIYGADEEGKVNTGSAYGTIFGIRLAFNSIYAFTDSTIRQGAYSIAMAMFGVPPLTFLVPIAQIAIVLAVAVAESAIDLACIKAGMAIPLYKTKDTWVLDFETLFEQVKDAAISLAVDTAKNIVDDMITSTVTTINNWLDMTSEELKNKSDIEIAELQVAIKVTVDTTLDKYISSVLDQVLLLCNEARNLRLCNMIEEGREATKEYIVSKLDEWVATDTEGATGTIMYTVKYEAVEYIKNNSLDILLDQVDAMAEVALTEAEKLDKSADEQIQILEERGMELAEGFRNYIGVIVQTINNNLQATNETVKSFIEDTSNSIKDAVSEGAEKLNETINASLDKLEPKNKKDEINANVKASLFSFQYSDYLMVFLLISLFANQEKVLTRTCDVIQANMALKEDDFQMKKAYTYLDLKATLEVKPIFMKLPFMPDDTDSQIGSSDWYIIKYHGIQGY